MTNQCCCLSVVANDRMAVVETCGKFSRTLRPGLNVVLCCVGECVAGDLSARLQQLDVVCETKTRDNVFLHATVSVQYEVMPDKVYEAFYKMTDPRTQITAYVYDTVRSTLPKINLDNVFDSKDDIAKAVKDAVSLEMPQYGYNIIKVLVTDLSPNQKVKDSMNEINAAARLRTAAVEKAEAQKILIVKQAEAEAESKYLQGVGISRQRQAIVAGLQESVVAFSEKIDEVSPKSVIELVLMTQYFDMLKEVGAQAGNTVVFIPNTPGGVSDIESQVRQALMEGQAANLGAPKGQQMKRRSQGVLGISSAA